MRTGRHVPDSYWLYRTRRLIHEPAEARAALEIVAIVVALGVMLGFSLFGNP